MYGTKKPDHPAWDDTGFFYFISEGVSMKKLSVSLAMLALALALGLAFVGCKTEADNPLNGRWLSNEGGFELTLSNGNFTIREDGVDSMKGKYTDSGSDLVLTYTDIYFDAAMAAEFGTTAGWKTKSQLTELLKQMGFTDAQINEEFAPRICPYTLNGNALTLVDYMLLGSSSTYTRQP